MNGDDMNHDGMHHDGMHQNGRIVPFQAQDHGEAQRLLPWVVNGRLDGDERVWVEQHIDGCSDCQRELDELRRLQAAWLQSDQVQSDHVHADPADGMPMRVARQADAGWRRLRERLQPSPTSISRPSNRRTSRLSGARWLGWAVAAQALLITVLAAALWQQPSAIARYHTLSAAPVATSGNLIIVFDPALPETRLRGLLRATDARIVDGPNDAGAYVLSVPAARLVSVRDALQAASGVTLVAALGPAQRQ